MKEINVKINSFFSFIRIGSGRKLLIFDLVISILFLYDVFEIKNLHLRVYQFSFFKSIWNNFNIKYVAFAILLIYLPTLTSAFINFLFRNNKIFRKNIPLKSKNMIFFSHFIISILFICFISISKEIQELSGFKNIADNKSIIFQQSYEYTPVYIYIINYITIFSGVGLVMFKFIFSFYNSKENFFEEFKLWFNLADISRDYFPKQKENLIFVNNASMAPTIHWVNNREKVFRSNYQSNIPTSDIAKKILGKSAENSRVILRRYLFKEVEDKLDFSIEFLPGTSRALEVGLSQIRNLNKIITSPYEHPSQLNVIEWFVALKQNLEYEFLKMDSSSFEKEWQDQKSKIIELIKSKLPSDKNKKVAILISEVHFITGLYINVEEIIQELRPNYNDSNLVFIIDGSQAVGNLLNPFGNLANCIRGEDFYYFSAHKWLLSPNTCGVLITEQNQQRYEIYPYDIFGKIPPKATIEPGVIFGINSSLEFLFDNDMFNFYNFNEKSKNLKKYFKENIGEMFYIVESETEEMNVSNFISIKPSNGYKWRDNNTEIFWKEITKVGVDLTLISPKELDDSIWWLRISFPYFLQLHMLKQLIKHLNKRVISFN